MQSGPAEHMGREGAIASPQSFSEKLQVFPPKLYENTVKYNTLPPQILSFQCIALPDFESFRRTWQ